MLGLIIGIILIIGAVIFYSRADKSNLPAELAKPPKNMVITVDMSAHIDDIEKVMHILDNMAVRLLRYIFKDVSIGIDRCFIKITINVEGVLDVIMSYWDIKNYCEDLVNMIMIEKGYDLIVSVSTESII